MRQLIEYFSKNHHLTNFLMFAVLVGGVLAWINIKKDEMPEFDSNWLSISASYPGASAEDVERLVTFEIEKRLRSLPGIEEVSSTSRPGSARLSVTLESDLEDKNVVIQSIKDASLDARLPERVKDSLNFFQWRTSEKAILDVALYLKDQQFLDFESRRKLQIVADALENQLIASPLLSRVSKNGYLSERLEIQLDPKKLNSLQLPITQVAEQIRSSNLRQPAGSLEDQRETKVSIVSELDQVDKLKSLVIRNNFEGNSVFLRDLGTIERRYEKNDSISKVNGHEAIIVNVYKASNADILDASDRAQEIIATFSETQTDVKLLPMDDESITVRNRIRIIGSNGIFGFILIVICLFIFLEWRSGIWVAMGLPFSLAFTAIMGLFADYSVNNVTLAAVIIVLGIVVDDAIIVAESISRKKSLGIDTQTAVTEGTRVVILPIIAAIMTTCIAFFPFYFFGGRFGNFVVYLPSIVSFMLLASLIESLFILPSHLQDFGPKKNLAVKQDEKKGSHWFFKVEEQFSRVLEWALKLRWLVLAGFLGIAVGAGYLYKDGMKFVMFPSEESKEVFLRVVAEEDLDRIGMAQKIREIEDLLLTKNDLIVAVRSRIGQSRRGG